MECKCNKCGMGVKGLTCSKCNSELVKDIITANDGSKVQVAKCPKGCGMIKSPTCCGQDMACST
ncbi:MAG TPA: hypothetical protein VJN02_06340 [Gammaproteobacteria bacterium]|nr:MAG: hypothetical protein A3E83_05800 [Gammaproteobacteria bacterium RIFCSPHIGHO2_12_FULL_41_20]HLB42456.1 hypothetical protein [Gammaproteobacteria bacterium]